MDMIHELRENHLTNRNLLIGTILFVLASYLGYKLIMGQRGYSQTNNDPINNDPINNDPINNDSTNNDNDKDDYYKKPTNEEINRIIKDEFSSLFKTFTREIKKTSREVSSLNTKNLFQNDVEKHKLVISSKDITHTSSHNTSNYTIFFDNENGGNKVGGYGRLINVIGFRLLKATIPSPPYNVTNNNNKIIFNFNGTDHTLTLTNGFYTGTQLGTELQTQLNSPGAVSSVSVTYDTKTYKYTISHSSTDLYFKWNENHTINNSHAYKLFGFRNIDGSATTSVTSDFASDLYIHFIDVVIPEIPSISCKKNPLGKNLIERIPIYMTDVGSGSPQSILFFSSHPTELMSQIYFYPISLNQLTIKLYDDSTDQFFQAENLDNSFEFEVTILKNVKLMK